MSAFNTPWFNSQDPSFFNSLNKSKVAHVALCAETEDFDEEVIQAWKDEGFHCAYVPLLEGGDDFIKRLHTVGDNFGVSEQYAVVAFGTAANLALLGHTKPNHPKLVAVVAYYPNVIPSIHTKYPASVKVLVHLAGKEVTVENHHAVLGLQGKRSFNKKRIDPGAGHGERMNIPGNFQTYTYTNCQSGFAESDLEEYDPVAAKVAFTRSLTTVRKGFRVEPDIETVRDHHVSFLHSGRIEDALKQTRETAHIIHTPTLTGGVGAAEIGEFYREFFTPLPLPLPLQPGGGGQAARLLSRTIGTDRVVDEIFLSIPHTTDIPWLLPGTPPTNRRIEITVVSIFHVVGTKLESEHVYWDQASVLVQAGLLDPKLVPESMKKKGMKVLPVVGAEAEAARGECCSRRVNNLVPGW